jgi:hypothetical protein
MYLVILKRSLYLGTNFSQMGGLYLGTKGTSPINLFYAFNMHVTFDTPFDSNISNGLSMTKKH